MFLFDTPSRILACLFLVTAMLSVGLQTTLGDLRSLLGSRRFLLRCLLANFVAVPVLGVVLARTLPLKPETAAALLILACTPGGISALQFTTKIKGAALLAGGGAVLLSFLAVFLSPVLLTLLLPSGVSAAVPAGIASLVLVFLVICQLVPLAAGMALRRRDERLAEKLSKLFAIASAVLFVVVCVMIMRLRKEALTAVGTSALLSMLLFIILSMAAGWVLGGPAIETRAVLATITGMRHAALSLLIALQTFADPAVQMPLVAFSVLMVPPSMLLTVFILIRSRKAARASQRTGDAPEPTERSS